MWSPDSTELVDQTVYPGPPDPSQLTIRIYDADTPGAERSLVVQTPAGEVYGTPLIIPAGGWSTTGRLSMSVRAGLVTFSAADGSDLRLVIPSTCAPAVIPCTRVSGARFSPSGQHLAGIIVDELTTSGTASVNRLVTVADQAGATPSTLLSDGTIPVPLLFGPLEWR
jgi:hypothetical protein